jgi:hypothetical protein
MDGAEGVGLIQDSWTEVDGDPIGGAHLSVDEREGEDTLSGFVRLGQISSPGLFSFSLFPFPFVLFSDF